MCTRGGEPTEQLVISRIFKILLFFLTYIRHRRWQPRKNCSNISILKVHLSCSLSVSLCVSLSLSHSLSPSRCPRRTPNAADPWVSDSSPPISQPNGSLFSRAASAYRHHTFVNSLPFCPLFLKTHIFRNSWLFMVLKLKLGHLPHCRCGHSPGNIFSPGRRAEKKRKINTFLKILLCAGKWSQW